MKINLRSILLVALTTSFIAVGTTANAQQKPVKKDTAKKAAPVKPATKETKPVTPAPVKKADKKKG